MKVSIIIPTYNRQAQLFQTLLKISKLEKQADEVIIVDQSDNTVIGKKIIRTEYGVKYLKIPTANAQAARNYAARRASSRILLFLDDDVDPEPGLVAAHLENYLDVSIHAVAGFYLEPGESETSQPRDGIWWRPLTQLEQYPASYSQRVDSPLWPSCNGSIRREVFLKLGGFDENYRYTLLDDTDLAVRMKRAGYRCVHDPRARLFHRKEPTGGNRPVKPGDRVIASREKWYTWFYFFWMNYGLTGVGEIYFRIRTNVFRRSYFTRPALLWLAVKEFCAGLGTAAGTIVKGRRLMFGTR